MSRLKEALENGKFGVTAEMAPPKGYDFTEQLEAGKLLAPKVHAVNLAIEKLCRFQLLGKIITLRGGHLGGNAEFTGFKSLFQHTHIISSPLS